MSVVQVETGTLNSTADKVKLPPTPSLYYTARTILTINRHRIAIFPSIRFAHFVLIRFNEKEIYLQYFCSSKDNEIVERLKEKISHKSSFLRIR